MIELVAKVLKLSLLLFVGADQRFRVPVYHGWKVDWCHRLGRLRTRVSLDEARGSSPFSWHLFLALGARELSLRVVVNWMRRGHILCFCKDWRLRRLSRWDECARWIYWLGLLFIDCCTLVRRVLTSKHFRGVRVLRLVRHGTERLRVLTHLFLTRMRMHLLSTLDTRSTKHR